MLDIQQLHSQAIECINHKAFVQAHPLLVSIIRRDPGHADAYFLLGIVNMEIGQPEKAIALIEKARSLDTEGRREYLVYLIKAYSLTRDREKVSELANTFLRLGNQSATLLDTVGVALSKVGQHLSAIELYKQAVKLQPGKESFWYNYGTTAKFMGRFYEAEDAFEKAIQLKPDYIKAYFALSELPAPQTHRLSHLKSMLDKPYPLEEQLHLANCIAKEYEKLGDYQAAFSVLREHKARAWQQLRYDEKAEQRLFTQLSEFTAQPLKGQGAQSDAPIFVVGMPRSGTTLMERILTSHSQVNSGEELHDFSIAVKNAAKSTSRRLIDHDVIEAAYQANAKTIGEHYLQRTRTLTRNHARFVDKLPFNFLYADLIRRALPNAKILCMLRDPMDTCIGNFRQLFSLQNPFTAYSLDLKRTAEYYNAFYQWMQHFNAIKYENFKLVEYEKLVTAPEQHIREIISFCGLPWEPACLRIEQNQAPVSTASKVQVREKINTNSVGRWRNYQPHTDKIEEFFKQQQVPIIDWSGGKSSS